MKEHYVTYDQAVKLKEFGFDAECNQYYLCDNNDTINHTNGAYNHNDNGLAYSAPRLDQAQAWLREVKEIDVLVFNCSCGYGWEISKANPESRGTGIAIFDDEGEDENSGMWLSYESALSAGIDKALELLTDKTTDK